MAACVVARYLGVIFVILVTFRRNQVVVIELSLTQLNNPHLYFFFQSVFTSTGRRYVSI